MTQKKYVISLILGNFGDFTLKIFKFKENRGEVYSKIKSILGKDFIDKIELQGK